MPLDPRAAVYTGTFDPVHRGHVDIIRRGSRLFQRITVGVGVNPEKAPYFSSDERVEMLERVCKPFGNVEVVAFKGLSVRFVREVGAGIMLRGLRTLSDMEYEFNMSLTNSNLDPEIETLFLMAKEQHSHFSSTLIRQIAAFGGEVKNFLPAEIESTVIARVRELPPSATGLLSDRD
ncbi:MAG: pantetheine-phosphate adenylyltransferase [Gemmataceae bacterium]